MFFLHLQYSTISLTIFKQVYLQFKIYSGSFNCIKGINDMFPSTPVYQAQTTVTFNDKITKILPFAYQIYLGFRSINITFPTQSQGFQEYQITDFNKNSTSVGIRAYCSNQNMLQYYNVNYVIIHQNLFTQDLVMGITVSKTPGACYAVSIAGLACQYPISFDLPPSGYIGFYSIRYLKTYVNNAYTTSSPSVNCNLVYLSPGMVKLYIGSVYIQVQDITLDAIFMDTFLMSDGINKKNVLYSPMLYGYLDFIVSTQYSPPYGHQMFSDTYFMGISYINLKKNQFSYDVSNDTITNRLKIQRDGSMAIFGFSIHGLSCNMQYFYFDDYTEQCQFCPDYCKQCDLLKNIMRCHECERNTLIHTDNMTCLCSYPYSSVTNICQNFTDPSLVACVTAQRIINVTNGTNGTNITNVTILCRFCSPIFHSVESNFRCVCMAGYIDSNSDGICQEICGDGLIFNDQCDDNNVFNNDGCDQFCQLQPNFQCDDNQPTYCQSLIQLKYQILTIIKKQQQGQKVQIYLKPKNSLTSLPFKIYRNQFQPEFNYIQLYIVTSENPYQQILVENVYLTNFDNSAYAFCLQFDYFFTIQNLNAKIHLNYEKTRYLNTTQQLNFIMQGSNSPLIISPHMKIYKIFKTINLVSMAVSIVLYFIGFLSQKFIGIQLIITFQLIFYSQLLIFNTQKWPVGFIFLKSLKLSTGYNDIFDYSYNLPISIPNIKLNHLMIKKFVLENLNTSFILLLLSLCGFLMFYLVRYLRELKLRTYIENKKYNNQLFKYVVEYNPINQKQLGRQISFYVRMNEKAFTILVNIVYWEILPIMSAISGSILVKNQNFILFDNQQNKLFSKTGSLILMVSTTIVFFVGLNSFINMWMHHSTIKKQRQKPQQTLYRRAMFIYLQLVGFLILFCNQLYFFSLFPTSVLVLLIHLIYCLCLYIIYPYRQSLHIHSISLLINNSVYLVFLVLINFINYFATVIPEIITLIFGYYMIFACGMMIILSLIRLYYQYRYGEALQQKIQKQRRQKEEEQKKRREELLEIKKNKRFLEEQNRLTQQQKMRARNVYLFENQMIQQQKYNLMLFLQQKNWDKEEKQLFYLEHYAQKPQKWLQIHDNYQYQKLKKLRQQQIQLNKKNQNINKTKNDNFDNKGKQDQAYKNSLRTKLKTQNDKNQMILKKKLQQHKNRILNDTTYAAKIMKNDEHKFMNQTYEVKK